MSKINMTRVQEVIDGKSKGAVVANNRYLRKSLGCLYLSLHGHDIVMFAGDKVIFDPKDHRTSTTRAAMVDAAEMFGLPPIGVSFAKERFRITMKGVEYLPAPNGTINIPLNHV